MSESALGAWEVEDEESLADGPNDTIDNRRRALGNLAFALASLTALLVVMSVHGFLPGQSQPTVQPHLASGGAECLKRMGLDALTNYCQQLGAPGGQPLLSGLPQTYLAALFTWLPAVDSWTAHVMVDVLCDVAALSSLTLLLMRWQVSRWIALPASLAYLTSLSILWINGFAATFNGFVLIPVHVFLTVVALDQLGTSGWPRKSIAVMFGAALLAVFTDGYGFFEGGMLVTVLVLWWWRSADLPDRRRHIGLATYVGSTLAAVFLYLMYVPPGSYATPVPISVFRAFGADATSFVLPQSFQWWTDHFGGAVDFSRSWGDGSASRSNYLGVVLIGLTGWILLRRRDVSIVRPLVVAGLIAAFLALGPSLKIWDMRDTAVISPASTSMPQDEATLWLPSTWLYEYAPGFDALRATFRWGVVAVLVVIMCGALAIQRLRDEGRKGLALALGVLAFIDVAPAYSAFQEIADVQGERLASMKQGPLTEITELVGEGDLVLFLPTSNDFLVNAMIPPTGATTYNVGIDKNVAYSSERWPQSVQDARATFGTPGEVDAVLEVLRGEATVVIFTHLSLRDAAISSDLEAFERDAAAVARTVAYERDDRFQVSSTEWFTAVRRS